MYIITGGTGYIGKNIAFYLLSCGEKVLLVDDYSKSNTSSLLKLYNKLLEYKIPRTNVYFYYLDLKDRQKTNTFFFDDLQELSKSLFIESLEGVIHCAGFKSVSESVVNPHSYYHNNILSTLNLIECLQVLNKSNEQRMLPHIPIIFSSSTTVYGNNESPLREDMKLSLENILCPYGKTKYMIEEILRDCSKYIKTVCLRYFNPVGCYSGLDEEISDKSTTIVPCLIKSIRSNTMFKIFGNDYPTRDGTCVRDFIDVRDLAKTHYLALIFSKKMENNFEVFNIGSEKGTTVKEFINTFESVNNIKISYEIASRREGDVVETFSDCSKAQKVLNFKCEYGLVDSIKNINLH